ncbi:hypothetical protein PN499_04645 [Kamptonema animale CS-326]|jgi:hypothetical protein|uniref:hypothetical protein n=1 Tax=Kamptonema animale TaxID=92934 RepID=UPI00232BAB56|nr:hypothetical protein [Kamptonema animale]MDB9510467.1 hypothetical protein [Kamptonema animale CS-326]
MITAVRTLIGLRLAIATAGQIVAVGIAGLSVRTAAYILGFSLGSISPFILPIISLLATLSGLFSDSCLSVEQLAIIDNQNQALINTYNSQYAAWNVGYQNWLAADRIARQEAYQRWYDTFAGTCVEGMTICSWFSWSSSYSVPPPTYPNLKPYPGHAATDPNCKYPRKVWLQAVWAATDDNFVTPKACWLIAYSWDKRYNKVEIKYNPYKIKDSFLLSRALKPDLVKGDRLKAFKTSDWKNLETPSGWDKGYWLVEQTDVECRGWQPSWLNPVK